MPFKRFQRGKSSPYKPDMLNANISKFDILRSDQKDKFYRKKLNNLTDELIKTVFKTSTSNTNIKLLSDLLYYGSTTVANRQTIGQEYYNLILLKETTRNVPFILDRVFLIAFRFALPYLINRLNKIASSNPRQKLCLALLAHLLYYAKKINLIVFYLAGSSYFKLENRLASVGTLSVNLVKPISAYQQRMSLVLGLLELAMLLLHAANELKDLYATGQSIGSLENLAEKASKEVGMKCSPTRINCPLCLEKVCHPTVTTCGHIFCWDCIQKHAAFEPAELSKCPTCRNVFEIRRLIYLYNFK